ncbi:MAG: hypothetical protein HY822_15800 [Acidobacteria bacterium]|nr:hypothetical protein [Acidobacteriota bacterium]
MKPHYKIDAQVPESGIYWCMVCMTPARFEKGKTFGECQNLCGKCRWELVELDQPS